MSGLITAFGRSGTLDPAPDHRNPERKALVPPRPLAEYKRFGETGRLLSQQECQQFTKRASTAIETRVAIAVSRSCTRNVLNESSCNSCLNMEKADAEAKMCIATYGHMAVLYAQQYPQMVRDCVLLLKAWRHGLTSHVDQLAQVINPFICVKFLRVLDAGTTSAWCVLDPPRRVDHDCRTPVTELLILPVLVVAPFAVPVPVPVPTPAAAQPHGIGRRVKGLVSSLVAGSKRAHLHPAIMGGISAAVAWAEERQDLSYAFMAAECV